MIMSNPVILSFDQAFTVVYERMDSQWDSSLKNYNSIIIYMLFPNIYI